MVFDAIAQESKKTLLTAAKNKNIQINVSDGNFIVTYKEFRLLNFHYIR